MQAFISLLAVAGTVSAWNTPAGKNEWDIKRFKNLVTFGDSYTDESRLLYFINNKGNAPPAGTYLPESFAAADGGRVWARYVIQYTGKNTQGRWDPAMTLYDYAVSGAVVSNRETPRYFSAINASFPDVDLYEVPAYLADKAFVNRTTHKGYFQPPIDKDNTVAAMFIGTNDIGVGAYLTDSQIAGNTLVSYLDQVYTQTDRIYASGIRNFVLFNVFPLDLAPIYANSSFGGGKPSQYWIDRPANTTAISQKVGEYIATVNEAYRIRTPYEVVLQKRYPGARFANFDVHAWALNEYRNAKQFFNGTEAPNVTGAVHSCADATCTTFTTSKSPDSYFWYDSLHPSEQNWRNLAREIIKVISGTSSYAKYYQ